MASIPAGSPANSKLGAVEIAVLNPAGNTVAVASLSPESTILELKQEIAIQSGHLRLAQQLSYQKVALNGDTQKLKDYGLKGKCEVTLVLKVLDVDKHIDALRAKGRMANADDLRLLCAMARDIFLKEPSFLSLQPPLVIGGHLMGCAEQLNYLFDTFGEPPASQYLFLGNYVSIGKRSIDTLTLLLLYKKKYPDKIHLLRGQHESASVSRVYGFFDECHRQFSLKTWKNFVDVFNVMPFCALIQDRILCVPSGLSPDLQSLDDLRKIDRPVDVPDTGLLCDLLWSYYEERIKGWEEPDKAVEMGYGPDVLDDFLQRNGLERLCCSPRVLEHGYESLHGDRLLQVFSVSNYRGDFDNQGAVLVLDENLEHRFVTHDIPWQGRA